MREYLAVFHLIASDKFTLVYQQAQCQPRPVEEKTWRSPAEVAHWPSSNLAMKTYWFRARRPVCSALLLGGLFVVLALLGGAEPAPPGKPTVAKGTPPFTGIVQKVDKTANTVTLNGKDGGRVFHITPQTKITKAGQPATLADAKVGEEAAGIFKDTDGKRTAISLRLGPKPEKTPAKK
jgi:hypothetical protein